MDKVIIYKPTQNRKTQEIIKIIEDNKDAINIVFTDNLCMLGSQTANRIVNQVDGAIDEHDNKTTISVHCESMDIAGVSRKEIHNHIYGLIISPEKQIRNIITLTNSIRLPQIKSLMEQLIKANPLFNKSIVPGCLKNINLYFDEADKHIMSIMEDLGDLIDDNEFIKDFYITATPKRILKIYNDMTLHQVENNLENYIPLQHANWIDIENEGYLPSIRNMLDDLKYKNHNIIPSHKFIFAPGINLKESHFDIGKDATCNYNILSVVVNSSGLTIMLPINLNREYLTLSNDDNGRSLMIPIYPKEFIKSLNKRRTGNSFKKYEDGYTYYEMVFDKKQLIYDNDNEFWKIMKIIRHFWKDYPILVTGSRCVERGITIQDPNDNSMHFTDGVLHSEISKTDSGSQMAGRFTLTYNSDKSIRDFNPINIYSSQKTKNYMINQEKKAMYAVKLASSGRTMINYNQWRNYERRSILGLKEFNSFHEAILYARDNFKGKKIHYLDKVGSYSENKKRLGSCNMITEEEDIYNGYRYNSFDMSTEGVKRPINKREFDTKCTRYICWKENSLGNPWRIWSVYEDLSDKKTLKYFLCWTPVAEIGSDGNESDSDSDL